MCTTDKYCFFFLARYRVGFHHGEGGECPIQEVLGEAGINTTGYKPLIVHGVLGHNARTTVFLYFKLYCKRIPGKRQATSEI